MTQPHSKLTTTEDSLASIQLDRLTVEDEAALISGGRVWQLRAAIGAAVVLAVAGVVWMKHVDTREAYVEAATSVRALHTKQISAFLLCAAPGTTADKAASKDALRQALQSASDRFGKTYTRTLAHCAPMLEQVGTELSALRVPKDVTTEAAALVSAAKDLQQTVEGAAQVPSYDTKRLSSLLDKVATGMQSYDASEEAFETALRTRAK